MMCRFFDLYTKPEHILIIRLYWYVLTDIVLRYKSQLENSLTAQELVTGQLPYYHLRTDIGITRAVALQHQLPARPERFIPTASEHGDQLWSILRRCWATNPGDRPRADEVRTVVSMAITPNVTPNYLKSQLESVEQEVLSRDAILWAAKVSHGQHGAIYDKLPLPRNRWLSVWLDLAVLMLRTK
jgi:hypothetical protein